MILPALPAVPDFRITGSEYRRERAPPARARRCLPIRALAVGWLVALSVVTGLALAIY